jgi:hypothetical protein
MMLPVITRITVFIRFVRATLGKLQAALNNIRLPEATALDELAERMGIEPEFRNAKGEIVRTNSETKRSLLAAMGVGAADDFQAREALEALNQAEWRHSLAPVLIVRIDAGPPMVELVLPAGIREITWSLTLEDGSEQGGQVHFAKLDLLDKRACGS